MTAVRGCLHCGHELPAKGKTGPAKTYCDSRCNRRSRHAREYIPHPQPAHVRRPYRAKVDRTGQRFASLIVLEQLSNGMAACRCDCGNEKQVHTRNLVCGLTVNCADRANHPDPRSKGLDIGYWAAHHRATAARGPASDHKCRLCPKWAAQWAYGHGADSQAADESGREAGLPYSPDPLDYWPLCRSHHRQFDMARARSTKGRYDLAYYALWALLRQGEELHELENGAVA
jgi:hypothetical protein